MNAPPFPINPQVGEWSGNWVWNGARWVASPTTGLRVVTQVFTQSGPYMPSPGLVSLTVECIGGGGAGGSVGPPPQDNMIITGGGGGSGGRSIKTLPAALVRGGVLVTVGDGGVGGFSGTVTNGGATSFGAFCVANGGGYGQPNNAVDGWGDGGIGAPPGIGDAVFPGACGFAGTLEYSVTSPQSVAGGMGGQISGGTQVQNVSPGGALSNLPGLPNTGAGGMGSVQNQVGTSTPQWSGSDGGSGICIVTEYCWGDRDQPDVGWRPPLDVNVSFPKPPWPGGQPGPWPPGVWWPPGGWWGPGPWGPGPGGPRPREAVEFEAGQLYDDQGINPQTGQPWEDNS